MGGKTKFPKLYIWYNNWKVHSHFQLLDTWIHGGWYLILALVEGVHGILYTASCPYRILLLMVPKVSLQMPSHNSRRMTWTPWMVPYWEPSNGLCYRQTGHSVGVEWVGLDVRVPLLVSPHTASIPATIPTSYTSIDQSYERLGKEADWHP